jgi:hypothetical protein
MQVQSELSLHESAEKVTTTAPLMAKATPSERCICVDGPAPTKARLVVLVIVMVLAKKKLPADSMTVSPDDAIALAKDSVQLEAAEAHVPLAAPLGEAKRTAASHTAAPSKNSASDCNILTAATTSQDLAAPQKNCHDYLRVLLLQRELVLMQDLLLRTRSVALCRHSHNNHNQQRDQNAPHNGPDHNSNDCACRKTSSAPAVNSHRDGKSH